MTSSTKHPNMTPQKDPTTAGLLSVIPGLGQMYNGESRKGMLFLAAGICNLAIIIGMLFNHQILQGLYDFGQGFQMRPNRQLIVSLMDFTVGKPASLVLIGLFIAFVAYSMRDAYDHAARVHRKHIYADAVMDMPEATSGSYLFHVTIMVTCLILAFFFLIPPPPRVQVTDIEFIQNQQEVKRKIQSRRKAEKNSENRGKHDPTKKVTPPSPAPKAPSKAAPQRKPTPAKPQPKAPTPKQSPAPQPAANKSTPRPTPRPMPTRTPTARPTPTPAPSPHAAPSPTPSPSPAPKAVSKMPFNMPNPFAKAPASPKPGPTPAPAPISIGKVGSPAAPAPRIASASTSSTGGTMPAPISNIRGTSGGGGSHAPAPVLAGGGGSRSSKGSGAGAPGPAPAPTRGSGGGSSGGGSNGPALAVAPSVPRPTGGGGGEGREGNPDRGAKPGKPSVEAQKDVDFGPYMADLQRRIKRAWFPPKGNESKRVVVVFKVHTNGTMSNLRIVTSSGVSIADQAALKAVQNAAPFRPLPSGAPSDVDIQFTFDYNVFKGGGKGVFRRF